MDGRAEPTALAAQQAAIQEVRARYERGELDYEAFRRALDALVLARDSDECQAILNVLPVSPLAALSALDAPPLPVPATATPPDHKRIVAFMSQIKKLRRPWQLGASTHAIAFMGEIKLDLRLAELPPHAKLQVTAFMGSAIIYVPRSLRVAVHTTVVMGDVQALGEGITGMIASGHEEHIPATATVPAQLEIEVVCFMGNVHVVLTDGRATVSIGELVRDALRAVASGARQGLRSSTAPYPSLPPGQNWEEGHPAGG